MACKWNFLMLRCVSTRDSQAAAGLVNIKPHLRHMQANYMAISAIEPFGSRFLKPTAAAVRQSLINTSDFTVKMF